MDHNMPMPASSITNKPSNGTSIYHTCRSVLDKLLLVEGMSVYYSTVADGNDPLTKLWELCRKGLPLATLFNALEPLERLTTNINCNDLTTSQCKKIIYHFIVACRNQLLFKEEDLFTLSDLYKDNTNGFVKVINTINILLNLLEEKGVICLDFDNDSQNSLPKDTRDKVVFELLETERKYVQDLEVLQDYMRELQVQQVLNPDTIHYVFGNLNDLVDFQRRFLIYLEEMAEKTPSEQNFGSIFHHTEDQFVLCYEPYCSNYFSAQDIVQQEATKLEKLANILNPVYELPSMLIKPVQRICKYPLLLQQLLKSMDPNWPFVDDLKLGLISVKRVTEKINETQRKHENSIKLEEFKRRIDDMRSAQIAQFGALCLHERIVVDESDKEMSVFFFERTILICKESRDASGNNNDGNNGLAALKKKRRGSLQPKGMIVLSRIISVYDISKGEGYWCLRINWKDKEEMNHTVFKFRNEEQVKLWETNLKKRMPAMKSVIPNTELASTKNTDADEEKKSIRSSLFSTFTSSSSLSFTSTNSSSTTSSSASISGRPQIPRYMTADDNSSTMSTTKRGLLPRFNSANNAPQEPYHYPASPPPSNPSSPTASTHTSSSTVRPIIDIATKFMSPSSFSSNNSSHSSTIHDFPLPPPHMTSLPTENSHRLHSLSNPKRWDIYHQQHIYSQTPSSPLDSPTTLSTLSSSPTSYFHSPTSTTAMTAATNIKIKLNFNQGIYVIMCSSQATFQELFEKVERKIRLVTNIQPRQHKNNENDGLKLKYQDEDGDLITINSDEDVQMAFESQQNKISLSNLNTTTPSSGAINLFISL
ncbi:hypothetical protein BDF20DRAFT_835320 [Mycotypha africana]|uniref:uncharacterized protein n=1 Tax=Mycotypha africana TaxID=64632 RepID=UPI00230118C0|nr:uncharacterized protein BDF20DRAFT_835320 [Mycotypha africana]KAI8979267.1 hypothetical protein BDF20DRAFT_835320 [Mycotypha africana]